MKAFSLLRLAVPIHRVARRRRCAWAESCRGRAVGGEEVGERGLQAPEPVADLARLLPQENLDSTAPGALQLGLEVADLGFHRLDRSGRLGRPVRRRLGNALSAPPRTEEEEDESGSEAEEPGAGAAHGGAVGRGVGGGGGG